MKLKLNPQGSNLEAVLELTLMERKLLRDIGLLHAPFHGGKGIPEFELGVVLPAQEEQAVRTAALALKRQIDAQLPSGTTEVVDFTPPPAPAPKLNWRPIALAGAGAIVLLIIVLVSFNRPEPAAPQTPAQPTYVYVPQPQQVSQPPQPAAPMQVAQERPFNPSEWSDPIMAPVGSWSEPVAIPVRHTLYRLNADPIRVQCRDLFKGWLDENNCPNGADAERFQSAGSQPVPVRVRFEKLAE